MQFYNLAPRSLECEEARRTPKQQLGQFGAFNRDPLISRSMPLAALVEEEAEEEVVSEPDEGADESFDPEAPNEFQGPGFVFPAGTSPMVLPPLKLEMAKRSDKDAFSSHGALATVADSWRYQETGRAPASPTEKKRGLTSRRSYGDLSQLPHSSRSGYKTARKKVFKVVGAYELCEELGDGTYGVVRRAFHIPTGDEVAIKIVNKHILRKDADLRECFQREIASLWRLNHSNVIRIYEVMPTHNNIYVSMELARGGDLHGYVQAMEKLSERDAKDFFWQIVSGMEYSHKRNVVHRDLKLENILLGEKKRIAKIADYGLSFLLQDELQTCRSSCGSIEYAAPEMWMGDPYDGRKADVWSCGVILFVMLTGQLPFSSPTAALAGERPDIEGVSDEARSLISWMLSPAPIDRPTLTEVREHAFFGKAYAKSSTARGFDDERLNPNPVVLKLMEAIGYASDTTRQQLAEKKNTAATACYFLTSEHLRRFGDEDSFKLSPLPEKKK